MKIIGKYKDYYDYLSGVYGVDEKLVLDRRKYSPITYIPSVTTVETLLIGEYMIQGLWVDGVCYFGDSVEEFSNQNRSVIYTTEMGYDKSKYWVIPNGKYSNMYCLEDVEYLGDKSPTWHHDTPIMRGYKNGSPFPILKEYGVASFLSPERVWLMLSEWLSKRITKYEEHEEPEDKIKIVSSGFDLKTSFRKNKQK